MKKQVVIIITGIIIICSLNSISGQSSDETNNPGNAVYIQEPVFSGKVYFRESGKKHKSTVMLVHGIGEDASDIWNNLIPVLEKQYHVITFDLPGFGRSDKPDVLYSPDNYAAFLKWIYDDYINGPMILIGHSMGGAVSLFYAGTHPDTVRKLIVADAAGIIHGAALAKNLTNLEFGQNSKYRIFKDQLDLLNQYKDSIIESTSEMLPQDISIVLETPVLRKMFFGSSKKVASASLMNTDFSKQLANIKAPLLLIWGEKDPVAPLRTGKMLSLNIQGAHLEIMPGLGHNPMLQEASEFNRIITDYLSNKLIIKNETAVHKKKDNIFLNSKSNVSINGVHGTIEIKDCRNIQISNIKSDKIIIRNSVVSFENMTIKSEGTGISAYDSDITITGGSFDCGTGFLLKNCTMDLAGVKIKGEKAAVLCKQDSVSTVIFSVCSIISPYNYRSLHEVIEIRKDNPI